MHSASNNYLTHFHLPNTRITHRHMTCTTLSEEWKREKKKKGRRDDRSNHRVIVRRVWVQCTFPVCKKYELIIMLRKIDFFYVGCVVNVLDLQFCVLSLYVAYYNHLTREISLYWWGPEDFKQIIGHIDWNLVGDLESYDCTPELWNNFSHIFSLLFIYLHICGSFRHHPCRIFGVGEDEVHGIKIPKRSSLLLDRDSHHLLVHFVSHVFFRGVF